VSCSGPPVELAALESLCERTSLGSSHRIGTPLSAITVLRGSASDSPAILIAAFPPAGTPEGDGVDEWPASEIRHAAYLVRPGSGDVISQLESWMDGEPLEGSLVTTEFDDSACGFSWRGAGTLQVGEVTVTLTWTSAIPC
jgi:hypothetical protein